MLRLLATNSIITITLIDIIIITIIDIIIITTIDINTITITITNIITITTNSIITITIIDIIIVSSPSLWSLPTRHCIVARFHDILRPLLLIRLNLKSDC